MKPYAEVERLLGAFRPFAARHALATAIDALPLHRRGVAQCRLRALDDDLAPRPGRAWFPVETAPGIFTGGLLRVDVEHGARSADADGTLKNAGVAAALERGAALAEVPGAPLRERIWPSHAAAGVHQRSFELALALAAWSRLAGEALPAHVAFTGWFTEEGVLRAPETASLITKRTVVLEEWGAGGVLLTGPTAALGCREVPDLSAALEVLGLSGRSIPVRDQQRRAERLLEQRDNARASAAARAARAAGAQILPPDELYALALLEARALTHEARSDEALAVYAEAEQWAAEATLTDRQDFAAVAAIALLDEDRPEDAVPLLEGALDALTASGARDARARYSMTQLCGTLARVRSALGQHDAAIRLGERALASTRPAERARNLGDLAFWYLRAGRPERALGLLAEAAAALAAARDHGGAELEHTARFLRAFEARAHLAREDHEAARHTVAPLDEVTPIDIDLAVAEIHAQLGLDQVHRLRRLDGHSRLAPGTRPTVATRLRARIELRRPHPDLDAVARWLGAPVADPAQTLARLTQRVPY